MKIVFAIIGIFVSLVSNAQEDSVYVIYPASSEKHLAIISGFQLQQNQFAELGFGAKKDDIVGHHPLTTIYGISNEFKLNNLQNDFVLGSKALLWLSNGFNIGLNIVHYTNFKSNTLRFRPEYGIGIFGFRIVYGYNFTIINKDFTGINKHNFTLNIILNAKRIKGEKKDI